MNTPVTFLCNGAMQTDFAAGRIVKALSTDKVIGNINIVIENIDSRLRANLSNRQYDLIEIVSFIYAADSFVIRTDATWLGRDTDDGWERDFHFVIPVFDVEFWNSSAIIQALKNLLTFLVNGKFEFEFVYKSKYTVQSQYFLDCGESNRVNAKKVILFSGGLDSLAGAIENFSNNEPVILVSHRSIATTSSRQKKLIEELSKLYSNNFLYIPVWINKKSTQYQEYTQRSRSFLYAALAVIVAELSMIDEINFYENGIISLNFPVTDEVLRSRATRTTHPITLKLFQEFFEIYSGKLIKFDNPYIYLTKAEVVGKIIDSKAIELIHFSSSCTRTVMASKTQKHCGVCSQCIDRRIAILSHNSIDTSLDYVNDVFIGERKVDINKNVYDKGIAVSYMRFAKEINEMDDDKFAFIYGSLISDAAYALKEEYSAIEKIISMHKLHAATVMSVLCSQIVVNHKLLSSGQLSKNSLLNFVIAGEHNQETAGHFIANVSRILAKAIPKAFASMRPRDEAHLQEVSGAALIAAGEMLQREFPYVAWSFSLSKPDFSNELLGIFLELKYLKRGQRPSAITEQIAADLVKYNASERYVLFIIYDPDRVIGDDSVFKSSVSSYPTAYMEIIR